MNISKVQIRPANKIDAEKVQEIRKLAWQNHYVNPESGVTKELLAKSLAKLPASNEDVKHYESMLGKPLNKDKNLVAILDNLVIGAVLYDTLDNGMGDIGVFVIDEYDGVGVGDMLLKKLIDKTTNSLQVIIFAKNPSRSFYKNHGFVEVGNEEKHYFSENVYLPTQTLILKRS